MVESTITRLGKRFFLRRSSASSVKPTKSITTSSIADSDTQYYSTSVPTTPLERGRPTIPESPSTFDRSLSPRARQRLNKPQKSQQSSQSLPSYKPAHSETPPSSHLPDKESVKCPEVHVVAPTPEASAKPATGNTNNDINVIEEEFQDAVEENKPISQNPQPPISTGPETPAQQPERPAGPPRRQSLVPASQSRLIKTLLEPDQPTARSAPLDYFSNLPPIDGGMIHRKVWVKRPGQSATLVTVAEDDLVDDVRELILRKYGNSLGKSFDAPDVALKVVLRHHQGSRHNSSERILGPEEPIGQTLDTNYPGGQTVDDALVIDVPQRRTPKPSPRYGHHMPYYAEEGLRPGEGNDYFPPYYPPVNASPNVNGHPMSGSSSHHPSMAVLTTGQLPPLPSPGAPRPKHGRPKYGRTHTSSPTILSQIPPSQSQTLIDPKHAMKNGVVPAPPPLPTPPAPEHSSSIQPPGRVGSPRPGLKPKKDKKKNLAVSSAPNDLDPPSKPASAGLLDGSIPPINVLVVEDNVINMRLLEAFMKRLKVRWKGAKDGKEAVAMWKTGGFHLVLMDIQLPIMSGLEATKEIRRLEKLHDIGAFSSPTSEETISSANVNGNGTLDGNAAEKPEKPKHKTKETDEAREQLNLIKSPVIIVALTASSLQSDRHEALAAGCNDFLTKPVNFVWLERKVTEWGCMQALIDFDGWRQWKDIVPKNGNSATPSQGGDTKPKPFRGIKGASAIKKSPKGPIARDVDESPPAPHRKASAREQNGGDASASPASSLNGRLKRPSGGRKKGSHETDGIAEE
ncbi:MAG: hypothetical protein Q9227_003041 [Pyrenula ochraceoflavens]